MDTPGIVIIVVTLVAAVYTVLKRNPLLFAAALILPFLSFKTPLGFITIPAFLAWAVNTAFYRITKMNLTSFLVSLLGIIFPLTPMLTGMINDGFFGMTPRTSGTSIGASIGAAIAFGLIAAMMILVSVIIYVLTSVGISLLRWYRAKKRG